MNPDRKQFQESVHLIDNGHYDQALEILYRLPQRVQVLMQVGLALKLQRRFEEAAVVYGQVLEERKDADCASIQRFLCLAYTGKFYEAIEEMEEFLSAHQSTEYINLCVEFLSQFRQFFSWAGTKFPNVRKCLEMAEELGPGNYLPSDSSSLDYVDWE